MSYPVIIPWLPSLDNEAAIAPVQSLTAAGSLTINSSVPGVSQGFGPYIYDRVIRKVLLSSGTTDNSGVTFTLTGIGSAIDGTTGNPTAVLGLVSEPITGPDVDGESPSANIYSQVISITSNDAFTDLSVGFGDDGITDYVFFDYNRIIPLTSLQVDFQNYDSMVVNVYQSLNKPQTINLDGSLTNAGAPNGFVVQGLNNINTAAGAWSGFSTPVGVVWANVSGTTSDSMNFTVIQQAI